MIGKATIADNKKQKHDIENYLKQVQWFKFPQNHYTYFWAKYYNYSILTGLHMIPFGENWKRNMCVEAILIPFTEKIEDNNFICEHDHGPVIYTSRQTKLSLKRKEYQGFNMATLFLSKYGNSEEIIVF